MASVIYRPIRCPRCGSKNTRVTSTRGRIGVRYHKCRACGKPFKSVEV
jgi:DNA-directed RNA polymerase subunit RPC12/RpoP